MQQYRSRYSESKYNDDRQARGYIVLLSWTSGIYIYLQEFCVKGKIGFKKKNQKIKYSIQSCTLVTKGYA